MNFENFRIIRTRCLQVIACITLSVVVPMAGANNESVSGVAPPTAAEIEAAITSVLMCDFDQKGQESYANFARVIAQLEAKEMADSKGDGRLGGAPFRALNTTFDEVVFAGPGGMGWSASANINGLEKALKQRGVVLNTKESLAPFGIQENVRAFVEITPTRKRILYLVPGRFASRMSNPSAKPVGVTVLCGLEKPTRAEVESKFGVPSVAGPEK
jgi:hypothetical protein